MSKAVVVNRKTVLASVRRANCRVDGKSRRGVKCPLGLNQAVEAIRRRLRVGPECRGAIREILDEGLRKGTFIQDDGRLYTPARATIWGAPDDRDDRLLDRIKRSRAARRRFGGVRGLTLASPPVEPDPDWDPDVPTDEEVAYAQWAATTARPTPPGRWMGR